MATIASQSKIKSRFNLCIQYTHVLAAEKKKQAVMGIPTCTRTCECSS